MSGKSRELLTDHQVSPSDCWLGPCCVFCIVVLWFFWFDLSWSCVLCAKCYQCIWIVHFFLPYLFFKRFYIEGVCGFKKHVVKATQTNFIIIMIISRKIEVSKCTNIRGLWCLTLLSTILQLYRSIILLLRKPEYPEKTTDLPQVHWETLSHTVISSTPRHEQSNIRMKTIQEINKNKILP